MNYLPPTLGYDGVRCMSQNDLTFPLNFLTTRKKKKINKIYDAAVWFNADEIG